MTRESSIALSGLILISAALVHAAEAEQPRRTFPVGTYRQEGVCTKLTQSHIDRTPSCSPYLGVISREDDRPQFVFSRKDGNAWFFVSSGPAVFSEKNSVATYQVTRIYDSETKAIFPLQGECVLTISKHAEEIKCTTWREKDRQQVAWEGVFEGNGVWLHKPR